MISESELARALSRWKARQLGVMVPAASERPANDTGEEDMPAPSFDEATRVARADYVSDLETPPAEVQTEVHLGEGDFEDHSADRR